MTPWTAWMLLGWALAFVFLVNSWKRQRFSRPLAGLLAVYALASAVLRMLR